MTNVGANGVLHHFRTAMREMLADVHGDLERLPDEDRGRNVANAIGLARASSSGMFWMVVRQKPSLRAEAFDAWTECLEETAKWVEEFPPDSKGAVAHVSYPHLGLSMPPGWKEGQLARSESAAAAQPAMNHDPDMLRALLREVLAEERRADERGATP